MGWSGSTGEGADAAVSVRAWVAAFGSNVAAVDFDAARELFDDEVVAFGTWSELLDGLDELEARQWRNVWPTITDFAFDVEGTTVLSSPDGLQAVAVAPWSSTGFGPDGQPFDRPGRATLVLQRGDIGAMWRAVHSHFSLGRDVPQRSHGRQPRS
jgi:ketosteroid isomerase-like protein